MRGARWRDPPTSPIERNVSRRRALNANVPTGTQIRTQRRCPTPRPKLASEAARNRRAAAGRRSSASRWWCSSSPSPSSPLPRPACCAAAPASTTKPGRSQRRSSSPPAIWRWRSARFPACSIDRAGVALVGACLMVASGALPLEDAYKAIDLDTHDPAARHDDRGGEPAAVRLLRACHRLGRARAPSAAACCCARSSRRPGLFSAFLVNDAICLVLAPLVLELTLRMRRNPVPYLLAVAMASNVGSTATITGNPQNIMIGSFSRHPLRALRRWRSARWRWSAW